MGSVTYTNQQPGQDTFFQIAQFQPAKVLAESEAILFFENIFESREHSILEYT
jgi:hypothetical protein